MRLSTLAAAFVAAFLAIPAAFAHSVTVGDLELTDLWARATPPRAPAAGGFVTITNHGTAPDHLIAVSTPMAGVGEVHEMKVEDGVMTMRPLEGGIEIPAGGTVTLKPGGYHLMFIELKEPFVAGAVVPATLTFEKAGSVDVDLAVMPIGAPGMGEGNMDHGNMGHGDMGQGNMGGDDMGMNHGGDAQ